MNKTKISFNHRLYNKLRLYGKYIILIIGVSFIFVECSPHDNEYDERKKSGLKGNVKTCLTHYNSIGKVCDTVYGTVCGFESERVTTITRNIFLSDLETFNRKGQIEKTEYFNREEDMKLSSYEIPIREKGVVIGDIRYTEEHKISYRINYHNISDSIVAYEVFDERGEKTSYGKTISQYNENRNIIRRLHIQHKFDSDEGEDNALYEEHIFQYDESQNIISMKSYIQDEFDSYVWYEYLEFDKKGNWIKAIEYNGEGRDDPKFTIVREIDYYWW